MNLTRLNAHFAQGARLFVQGLQIGRLLVVREVLIVSARIRRREVRLTPIAPLLVDALRASPTPKTVVVWSGVVCAFAMTAVALALPFVAFR